MPRFVRAVVVIGVSCAIAGCTGGGPGTDSPGPDSGVSGAGTATEKNRLQWVMPLDAYMVDEQLDYAIDVLTEPCMQANGYDYRRPAVDVTKKSPTMTISGRSLFNVESAAKWGYSGAPDPNADVLAAAQTESMSWSPEELAQYGECLTAARAEFPSEGARISNFVSSLGLSAWSGAKSAPEVVAAAEDWVRCMQPLGFSDLPQGPNAEGGGTPTPAMSAAFGEVVDGQANAQTPQQEAEEIRIATFDAECQESSGYAQALYDAEWDRQVTILKQNEAALTNLLEEKAAYEARANELLREAGLG